LQKRTKRIGNSRIDRIPITDAAVTMADHFF
jgi:hypothetical protein